MLANRRPASKVLLHPHHLCPHFLTHTRLFGSTYQASGPTTPGPFSNVKGLGGLVPHLHATLRPLVHQRLMGVYVRWSLSYITCVSYLLRCSLSLFLFRIKSL